MRMLIVALQRPVRGWVAVHAARIHDHLGGLAEQRARARGRVGDAVECRGRLQIAILRLRRGGGDDDRAGQYGEEKRCTKAHRDASSSSTLRSDSTFQTWKSCTRQAATRLAGQAETQPL